MTSSEYLSFPLQQPLVDTYSFIHSPTTGEKLRSFRISLDVACAILIGHELLVAKKTYAPACHSGPHERPSLVDLPSSTLLEYSTTVRSLLSCVSTTFVMRVHHLNLYRHHVSGDRGASIGLFCGTRHPGFQRPVH